MAEGFVLKPDARVHIDDRYATKWKIPEFDDARFDESLPFDAQAAIDAGELTRLAAHW